VAREEYEFLGQDLTGAEKDLVLRKPQLDTAKADVDSAQAALDEAKLALERTRVVAPFDALVVSENVDVGTRVSTNDTIANLVGTASYWVELAVPSNQLRWLDSPATRRQQPSLRDDPEEYVSTVKLYNPGSWGDDSRVGRLVRVLGNLTEEGRMARVLVEIPDPLAQQEEDAGKPIVLLGSYLRADVAGRTLENVVALDRAIVHDGDRVWIMNADDQLEFRQVHVAFSNKEQVFIDKGITEGERIVTTDIPTAAEGMPLRTSTPAPGEADLLGAKEAGHGQGA
jgi:RND family efflux transporter MFP subunit